jgi:dynein heavy chain
VSFFDTRDDSNSFGPSLPPSHSTPSSLCVQIDAGKDIEKQVITGDFSAMPLEQLLVVAQEVYLPLIANPFNQEGWPDVISKDVVENYHRFLANLFVTIGLTKGKTLLPLPPSDSGGDDKGAKEKERVHSLESAVVTWTRQIKNVLKTDPENLLKAGEHPGPLAQIKFWEAKAANLNSIHDQVPHTVTIPVETIHCHHPHHHCPPSLCS